MQLQPAVQHQCTCRKHRKKLHHDHSNTGSLLWMLPWLDLPIASCWLLYSLKRKISRTEENLRKNSAKRSIGPPKGTSCVLMLVPAMEQALVTALKLVLVQALELALVPDLLQTLMKALVPTLVPYTDPRSRTWTRSFILNPLLCQQGLQV